MQMSSELQHIRSMSSQVFPMPYSTHQGTLHPLTACSLQLDGAGRPRSTPSAVGTQAVVLLPPRWYRTFVGSHLLQALLLLLLLLILLPTGAHLLPSLLLWILGVKATEPWGGGARIEGRRMHCPASAQEAHFSSAASCSNPVYEMYRCSQLFGPGL
jgi:hypothetical protein